MQWWYFSCTSARGKEPTILKLPLNQILYFIDRITGLNTYDDTLRERTSGSFRWFILTVDTEVDHTNIGNWNSFTPLFSVLLATGGEPEA